MSIYNLAISLIGMRYEVHNKNGLKPATYKDRFCWYFVALICKILWVKKFVKTQRFCSICLLSTPIWREKWWKFFGWKIRGNSTRKVVKILWLKKNRENATVLRYLIVDNFNLTRKSDAKPMMCFGVGERLCRFLSSNDTLNCSGSLLFLKRGVGLLGT